MKLSPVVETLSIDMISSDFVWSIVLGVLPVEYKGLEDKIMENSRKDSTAEKIDNIEMITDYAEYFLKEKPDFGYANLELFSQALHQLIKYTSGDLQAENSLKKLKDLYISFMTFYIIESIKAGRNKISRENIIHFSEKIFRESPEIKARLNDIVV